MEYLRLEASDPVERSLREAPLDDEPVSADDLVELEAAGRELAEGRVVSHAEARRTLLRD